MNETILQFILDMLNCAIGVFGGFILAIYLQNRTERKTRDEKKMLVIKNVSEELTDIVTSLQQYINLNKCLNCRIQTPSWDSILYSGIVLELIEEPTYSSIVKVYSMIKNFNEERQNQSDQKNKNDLKEIVETVREITASLGNMEKINHGSRNL